MTALEWWEVYTSEASHCAELSRNRFLSRADRVRYQREAAQLYRLGRRFREVIIAGAAGQPLAS